MKREPPYLFVINPGSTSTKTGLFRGREVVFETELAHTRTEIDGYSSVIAQKAFRQKALLASLREQEFALANVDIFVGRGGLLRPVPGGVFKVNEKMLRHLRGAAFGEHASNLGAVLAHRLASRHRKPSYIANPVVVDEFWDVARVSGHPAVPRESKFHALSQKAVAGKIAVRLGRSYSSCNMIVAHMGGGITVGAHRRGRVVDVNNGLEGDGPFTPERTGGMPFLPFHRFVTDNNLSPTEVTKLVTRGGGLLAHLGTNDFRIVAKRARDGNRKAALLRQAFIYNIAKQIGAMSAVLSGNVDAIVLTGGLVKDRGFVRELQKMIGFIAPVHVIVETSEMEALATAVMDVVDGKQKARRY